MLGSRLRGTLWKLALALPSVWPSVSVDDVGIPDPLISQLDIPPACAPYSDSGGKYQ